MIREYIMLAAGCVSVGVVLTFIVLSICQRYGINIDKNIWVVAIPLVLSLILNITLVEIYHKFRKKKSE